MIEDLTSAYNLIGEIETRITLFLKKNSTFQILHVYLAIVENYEYNEFEIMLTIEELASSKLRIIEVLH